MLEVKNKTTTSKTWYSTVQPNLMLKFLLGIIYSSQNLETT